MCPDAAGKRNEANTGHRGRDFAAALRAVWSHPQRCLLGDGARRRDGRRCQAAFPEQSQHFHNVLPEWCCAHPRRVEAQMWRQRTGRVPDAGRGWRPRGHGAGLGAGQPTAAEQQCGSGAREALLLAAATHRCARDRSTRGLQSVYIRIDPHPRRVQHRWPQAARQRLVRRGKATAGGGGGRASVRDGGADARPAAHRAAAARRRIPRGAGLTMAAGRALPARLHGGTCHACSVAPVPLRGVFGDEPARLPERDRAWAAVPWLRRLCQRARPRPAAHHARCLVA
mmetsp:Transcript_614/g.1259  ORF Transcript_614/g.1259 Transcript_614/m.1259 type:complete len:284 (-) Transcript_614:434-1285(-)